MGFIVPLQMFNSINWGFELIGIQKKNEKRYSNKNEMEINLDLLSGGYMRI